MRRKFTVLLHALCQCVCVFVCTLLRHVSPASQENNCTGSSSLPHSQYFFISSSTSSSRGDYLFWQTVSIRCLSSDEMQQLNQLETPIGNVTAEGETDRERESEEREREKEQLLESEVYFTALVPRSRHKFRAVRVKIWPSICCTPTKVSFRFLLRLFHGRIFIAFRCFQLVELCSLNIFIEGS